jgi:uncharacterized protein (UPF0335 family)
MPCRDGRDNENVRIEYVNGVNPTQFLGKINKIESEKRELEAGLCAIITELEKMGIAKKVLIVASKNGSIDLFKFWENHHQEDKDRLRGKIKTLSNHEKDLLKKMARNNEL